MQRICLVHVEKFHKEVIPKLREKDICVCYICATPEQLTLFKNVPDCIFHSVWDAIAGRPPGSLDGDKRLCTPPGATLIEALLPCEVITLQMLERVNYDNKRVHELRNFYLRFISYWRGVIEIMRPDAVVFQSAPHMGFDYVFYALCQILGIKTLIIERTYLPDRLIIINSLYGMPSPPKDLPSNVNSHHEDGVTFSKVEKKSSRNEDNYYDVRNRLKNRIDPWTQFGSIHLLKRVFFLHMRALVMRLLRGSPLLLKRCDFLSSSYALSRKMPLYITHIWRLFLGEVRRDRLRQFYESQCQRPDLDIDYVYLPLQYQPERTSIPMGDVFADQLLALKILVDSLPQGWKVYVKEHPRQFSGTDVIKFGLARSEAFYKDLSSYGPEKLGFLSPSEPSDTLIRKSRCVVTVAGTAGWEAVRQGIPAVVFGYPWYVYCPGVYQVSSLESCSQVLKDISSGKFKVLRHKVESYLHWLSHQGTFRGYFSDVFGSHISPEENARFYAEAIAARLITDQ